MPDDAQPAHMLLGSAHLDMALAAAKSLMLVSDKPIRWILHDDGTLSAADVACLDSHLPGALIVDRREADALARETLKRYPALLAWRSTGQVMPLKLLDVALWARAPRLLYVDSDVLFFREPSLLLHEARAASGPGLFNRDLDTVYPVTPDAVRAQFGVELLPRINAGLYVIDRAAVDLDRLEAWLADPFFDGVREAPIVDQMLHAMLACVSSAGAGYLPDTYDMLFSRPVDRLVCRHYAGWFRHGFVLEGVAHLLNECEFERRWFRATRGAIAPDRDSAPVSVGRPRRRFVAGGESRRRVLVAAYLSPPGGGSAVGAWTVQALRGPYALSVLTWGPVDLDRVNEAFGTTLTSADAEWLTVPRWLRRLLALLPVPAALLGISVTMRVIRSHAARRSFDAIVGTMNELDIGRLAIQYVHYPWAKYPRPDVDYRWYHVEPAVRAYRWAASAVAASRQQGGAVANVTLANSAWTARLFEAWYGQPCRVLYPPVVGGFPDVPWESRERAFIAVGRVSPEKELEKLVRILAEVRQRGHAVRLRIAGHVDNRPYADRVRRLAETTGDWVEFHEDLPRQALAALICRHRYGIHGMTGEHFGIAPAELQLAGCVTFVPADGGQIEIVDRDERVMYHDEEDAARKIVRMLSDDALESGMRRDGLRCAALFSTGRFEREMRAVVERFLADRGDAA